MPKNRTPADPKPKLPTKPRLPLITGANGAGLSEGALAFCDAYVETGSATEAYKTAFSTKGMFGNRQVAEAAMRMLKHAEVENRIKALQTGILDEHDITLSYLIAELKVAAEIAKESGHATGVTQAIMAMAKLAGFDKPETINADADRLVINIMSYADQVQEREAQAEIELEAEEMGG